MSNYVVMPKDDWQDALDAIREKNGNADLYTSGQVGNVIRAIHSSQSSSALRVTTAESAVVTITNGETTYSASGPVAVFENLAPGVWQITAEAGMAAAHAEVEVGVHEVDMPIGAVYGISRDITASSPDWTRTDLAVGLTATASVGTSAGQSDFDSIYPWSGIKRETLSTGDIMVKIPKFYYQRSIEENIEYIKITDMPIEGFALHPLFNHGGAESEYVYVGAYKTSDNNKSVTGATPQGSQTRPTFRANAQSKGDGWGLIDIAAVSAIQMLMLVEFATNNVQSAIGRGYCDSNTTLLQNGSCDIVPNLTGRPAGTDGKTGVVYRGIENFWGNLWEWVDGVNFNGGTYYVCNDPSKYADDTSADYEALTFTASASWAQAYITQEGLDVGSNPHVMLPSATGTGSATTYQCDAVWTSTGWKVFAHGGNWTDGSSCGLFAARFNADSSGSGTGAALGSRLLYIPQ